MFYVANDSKCVLAAPEGFARIDLCVCFSVDVNQTKHNERKYFFHFFQSVAFAYWQEQTKHYQTPPV